MKLNFSPSRKLLLIILIVNGINTTLKAGSEGINLLKAMFSTNELIVDKIVGLAASCRLSEEDIRNVYAGWKQGGTVQKPRFIQSIIMNKGTIELVADITNSQVEIVFS